MPARLRPFLRFSLPGLVALIVAGGAWRGFSRGGQDFRVFHYAGGLVLDGRWDALYAEGPDRYLYAPGFALLIAPFAALPAAPALALWLLATLAAFTAAMRALARRLGPTAVLLAVLFSARPLLIDLRYGQVNLLILSAAIWALFAWFERAEAGASRRRLALAWAVFAIAAFTKIYPLALFALPLLGRSPPALVGAAAGAAILLAPPAFVDGTYAAWFDALARKGMPTDTHNQSLLAFLARVFGGEPFYSLGMGGEAVRFGGGALSIAATRGIWIGFSLAVIAGIVGLARRTPREGERPLVSGLLLALCFLPAHLIWKSYFALGIPLAAALFAETERDPAFRRRALGPMLALGLALGLASGDVLGPRLAAYVEACSPFFWANLALVITGFARLSSRASKPSSA